MLHMELIQNQNNIKTYDIYIYMIENVVNIQCQNSICLNRPTCNDDTKTLINSSAHCRPLDISQKKCVASTNASKKIRPLN